MCVLQQRRSKNSPISGWLHRAGLKAETKGFLLAEQAKSMLKRNCQANILTNEAEPKSQFCDTHCETIDHLGSGSSVLTRKLHKVICMIVECQLCSGKYQIGMVSE